MAVADESSCFVSFERVGDTIRVYDEIERQFMDIDVDSDPELRPTLTDPFLFPVDDAVSVVTSRVRVHGPFGSVSAWNGAGTFLGEYDDSRGELPRGTYHVNVTGSVLVYLQLPDSSPAIFPRDDGSRSGAFEIDLEDPSPIRIGARSLHTRPEATITVPDDPEALLEALPYLSASIREFSSERSWPTLRGHPPAIERGETLDVPSRLRVPDTGVTITTPVDHASLYHIAPLAFYLGADLEASERPELHLENGYVEPLATPTRSLAERTDELLARCLLLDSLVRQGGYVAENRIDYDEIAANLPFYPPNLYGESLSAQLLEYLEVSGSALESYYPCWPMTAVLRPGPADVELLSPLVHELARVHVAPQSRGPGCVDVDTWPEPGSSLVIGCTHRPQPPGTCLLLPEAYENALEHGRSYPDEASVAILTDDPDRAARLRTETVDPEGGSRAGDCTVVSDPTCARVASALGYEYDLLFCDLPLEHGTFACADGLLGPESVPSIRPKAVVVRGDAGRDVATTLVRRGVVFGLVLADAISPEMTARFLYALLNGLPLVESVRLADVTDATSCTFVGNTAFTVSQSPGRTSVVTDLTSTDGSGYEVSTWTVPTDKIRLGATWSFDPDTEALERVVDRYVSDGVSLTGAITRHHRPVLTCDVDGFVANDTVVRLDGRLVCDDGQPTGSDGRESARRSTPNDRP